MVNFGYRYEPRDAGVHTVNIREFKSTRPNRILFETITFSHSSFGTINLVANMMNEYVFEGVRFYPIRMDVAESQQSNTPVINATVKFSRLAQDFKQQLKMWRLGSRIEPIICTNKQYDSIDINTAIKSWTLYVSSVSMDDADVTVGVTVKNPMNSNIGILYNVTEFPGLVNT